MDAVHGNRKEITRAGGEDTFAKATAKILSLGPEAVLLTKEGDGAEIVLRGRRVSQPAFEIQFVEPSGCGDAFCAGAIYAIMQTRQRIGSMDTDALASVLAWGQALGASAATEVGCVAGVTQANVRALLDQQGKRLLQETRMEQC